MGEPAEQSQPPLSKAELRARLIGNSLEHDQEDIEFWRNASDTLRGQTLYQLLVFAQNILNSTPPRPEEPRTFPSFPPQRKHQPLPPPTP